MQHTNAAAAVSPTGPGIAPVRTDRPEAAGLSSAGYQQAGRSVTQPSPASANHFSSQTNIHSYSNYAQPQHSNGSSPTQPARGAAAATHITAETDLTQQQLHQQQSSFKPKVAGFRAPSAAGFLHQYKKKQQRSTMSATSAGGAGTLHSTPQRIQQQDEEQQQHEQAQHLSQHQQHDGANTALTDSHCSLGSSQQQQQQRSSPSSSTAAESPRLRDRYARTGQSQQHSSSSASTVSSSSLREKYAAAAAAAQPKQQHHSSQTSSNTPAVLSSSSLQDKYVAAAAATPPPQTQQQRSTSSNSSSPRLRDKYGAPAHAGRQQGSCSSGSVSSASGSTVCDKPTSVGHAEQQQRSNSSSSPLAGTSTPGLRDKFAAGSRTQKHQQHSRSSSSSPLPSSSSPRLRDKFSVGGRSQQLRDSSGSSSAVPSMSSVRMHDVHAAEASIQTRTLQSSSSSLHVTYGVSSPRLREKYGASSCNLQQQQQHIEQQSSLQQQQQAPAVLGQSNMAAQQQQQQQQQQAANSAADRPSMLMSSSEWEAIPAGGTAAQPAIATAAPESVPLAPAVLSNTELELLSAFPDANVAGVEAAAGSAANMPAARPDVSPTALTTSAAVAEALTATETMLSLPQTSNSALVPAEYQATAVAGAFGAAAAAEAGGVCHEAAADSKNAAAVTRVAETMPAAAAGIAALDSEAAAESLGIETAVNAVAAAGAAGAARREAAAGNASVADDDDAAADAATSQDPESATAAMSAAPSAAADTAAANAPAVTAVAGLSSSSWSGAAFRGSASLPPQSSSDLSDTSSSDISSSVSGAQGDSSAQQIGLEIDFSDDGDTTSLAGHQIQHQRQQLMMQAAGHHRSSSKPSVGGANQQQQQQGQQAAVQTEQQCTQRQQQQDSSGWGGSRGGAEAAAMVGRSISNDPDYEVPQGKLTETQVLMSHVNKLHLDRYGFIVTEAEAHVRAARAKRTPGQIKREQRHVAKWRRMLGSNREEFMAYASSRPNKVKRRVRKGIPDEFRGLVWQYLSGGRELMQQHPGRYAHLLTTSNEPVDLEIMRDLNRTFPNHVFFHQRQGPGQQSLFHVLRAYSAYDQQVGYVQGMGFVTAILLMYMSEEEAFWTLVALLRGTSLHPPLEGMYQAGMPLLQQCLFQFQELLKQENPKLGMHLEQEGVVPSMYCTHWFNTIFAYSLPFEQLLRVWDVFLLEGLKMVFRVGIVLLTSSQDQLLGMPFEKLVACLNGRKFPVLEKHPDVMLKAALRIPVSKRLEQLREKHQQQVAAAEAAARASSSGGSGRGVRDTIAPVAMGPAI